jgi:hypothetical protein
VSPGRRQAYAKQLGKNPLLPLLVNEHRAEMREAWEDEQDAEKREKLWTELHALNNVWDFLDARINAESAAG